MQSLYYLKWPLIIFIFGTLVRITGAFLKIRHWPGADETLLIGTVIMLPGAVYALIKLILLKRDDQHLNKS